MASNDEIRRYIRGCHILHFHGIVDAYGHLSYRLSDRLFIMSRYLAPALVSSLADLVVYKIEDGEPLMEDAPNGFSERYIHSEIYKAYPKVKAVVHSHSLDVVPFSISPSTPLRACFHMAGFLGTEVPVWDAATVYREDETMVQSMLVRSTRLGASLAQTLGVAADAEGLPRHPVALMRGHGFVCTGDSIEMVISKSIYTAQNARVQMAAQSLAGGGGHVHFFNEREAADAGRTTIAGAAKPWPLWVAEVELNPLYSLK
ncbi:arad-like aldolase/epimerase [Coniochaeta ligniaria NRRL 30616]|uniref:Arad-like aldolase/epimerase n=1 Tax=Coniochaeta ligniaria NRRL 30616 TaxID=1408157 RepID=A0A1J7I9C8_9PEZI|nr:arad-like aldolase/epimerase [Coniochaeta ligniaria NRRL 30616]